MLLSQNLVGVAQLKIPFTDKLKLKTLLFNQLFENVSLLNDCISFRCYLFR